jgi:hypothetical protein
MPRRELMTAAQRKTLHRVLGDMPTNLGEFFDEVRKAAR